MPLYGQSTLIVLLSSFISHSLSLSLSLPYSFLIGYLTDRFNKKHVLICTCFLGLMSSLMFGFTTSIQYAVIARVVQGIPGIICFILLSQNFPQYNISTISPVRIFLMLKDMFHSLQSKYA